MKRLSSSEVGKFPYKNVIVRALGMKEAVQVDLITDVFRPGDIYLMCSDGLTGMISDEEMARILGEENDLDAACGRLVAAANANGGVDNITCVLGRIDVA